MGYYIPSCLIKMSSLFVSFGRHFGNFLALHWGFYSLGGLLCYLAGDKIGNWDPLLPIIGVGYNKSRNRSTVKSQFEIVHGLKPLRPIDLLSLIFKHVRLPLLIVLANTFMISVMKLREQLPLVTLNINLQLMSIVGIVSSKWETFSWFAFTFFAF